MLIQTRQIKKSYFTDEIETTALRDVDLSIEKGEFVSLMGPSGCGKSTLLNILGLIEKPDKGSYIFDGVETTGMSWKKMTLLRRGNIGYVFQNFNLADELNVFQNVALPLFFQGTGYKEQKKRVTEILETMRIGHRAKHYPQQLSGGQQQRVALARAMVLRPRTILADEPTGNLDSKSGIQVLKLLSEYNRKGTTIIMVTHSLKDASYAHRIIHLHDGIIKSGNENSRLDTAIM